MNKTFRGLVLVAALAALFYLPYRLTVGTAIPDRSPVPGERGGPASPTGCERGAVRVPATVLWAGPGQMRDYDELILRDNNDPVAWAGGMDASMRLWLVDKADSMALFGEPVDILEDRGEWLKVAAVWQKTTLNERGYPGWVPAAHIARNNEYSTDLKRLPGVVVTAKTTHLYKNEELTDISGEVAYQTRLPLLEEKGRAATVRLPDGATGFLTRSDLKRGEELAFSWEGIVDEARKFLGAHYLWGGTASFGFDCSGFTMRLYQSQGLTIPRDADEQARGGTAVSRQDLLPGDLLFYAAKGGQGQIHHVGMYIGNGQMIHAPNSRSLIRIEAIDSGDYGEEYWGARRYAR